MWSAFLSKGIVFYGERNQPPCIRLTTLRYCTSVGLLFCDNITRIPVISVTSGLQIRNIIRITHTSNACLLPDYECTHRTSSPQRYIDIIMRRCSNVWGILPGFVSRNLPTPHTMKLSWANIAKGDRFPRSYFVGNFDIVILNFDRLMLFNFVDKTREEGYFMVKVPWIHYSWFLDILFLWL